MIFIIAGDGRLAGEHIHDPWRKLARQQRKQRVPDPIPRDAGVAVALVVAKALPEVREVDPQLIPTDVEQWTDDPSRLGRFGGQGRLQRDGG